MPAQQKASPYTYAQARMIVRFLGLKRVRVRRKAGRDQWALMAEIHVSAEHYSIRKQGFKGKDKCIRVYAGHSFARAAAEADNLARIYSKGKAQINFPPEVE